jgi:hypothetical protein
VILTVTVFIVSLFVFLLVVGSCLDAFRVFDRDDK